MGHGVDFGSELILNHRAIRAEAAASTAGGEPLSSLSADGFYRALGGHLRLLREHVLPALTLHVQGGADLAAMDAMLLDSIQLELSAAGGPSGIAPDRPPDSLVELVETQFGWEREALLPLLESEMTWLVLDDLADRTQAARAL